MTEGGGAVCERRGVWVTVCERRGVWVTVTPCRIRETDNEKSGSARKHEQRDMHSKTETQRDVERQKET